MFHTMLIKSLNCKTEFKYFGVVQMDQYTFGEQNARIMPEPKRMSSDQHRHQAARKRSATPAGRGAAVPAATLSQWASGVGPGPSDAEVVKMLQTLDPQEERDIRRQTDALTALTRFAIRTWILTVLPFGSGIERPSIITGVGKARGLTRPRIMTTLGFGVWPKKGQPHSS